MAETNLYLGLTDPNPTLPPFNLSSDMAEEVAKAVSHSVTPTASQSSDHPQCRHCLKHASTKVTADL